MNISINKSYHEKSVRVLNNQQLRMRPYHTLIQNGKSLDLLFYFLNCVKTDIPCFSVEGFTYTKLLKKKARSYPIHRAVRHKPHRWLKCLRQQCHLVLQLIASFILCTVQDVIDGHMGIKVTLLTRRQN